MELGEASASAVVSENHDEDCYFCKASDKPTTEINDLTDNPDEDAAEMEDSLGEYKFKNDAGKLGTALGGKPSVKAVSLGGKNYDAAVAAHHLIPGNASLKKVKQLMKFMWTDGEAEGNIGYNVNAKTNGVWLPGNYGVRPWGTQGKAFEEDAQGVTAKEFAFEAMEVWSAQFHDAHETYSEFVESVLRKMANKLRANEELWCPEQKKKNKDKPTHMFEIVGRLNTVSARMKRMLVFPTSGWKVNVYTSRFVQSYMTEKDHQLTNTDSRNKG
jgi:hypothetical protein